MTDSFETAAELYPIAAPVVVVVGGVSAGFGVPDGRSLRFHAIHPRFGILDGSRFARAEQLRRAARRVARASQE